MPSKDSEHKIAILLATFNGEKFIKRQLDTILSQKNVNVKIFISDDQSNDQTLKIINDYIAHYSNITLVSSKIRFGSAPKNFFYLIKNVDVSPFSHVAFADQDDIWMEKKLLNAVTRMEETSSSAYSSNFIACWEAAKKCKLIRKNYPLTEVDYWFEGPGPGCSQVFSTESFMAFQRFVNLNWNAIQPVRHHDWLIYAFMRYNNYKWLISNSADLYYMQHETNDIGVNSGLKALKYRFKLLRSG